MPKKFLLALSSVCGISLLAGWAAGRFLPREGGENDLRRGQEKEREAHQLELRNRQLVFRIKELEEKLGGLAERKEAGEGKAQGDGAGSKAMSPASSRVADNSEELSLQRLLKTPLDEVKWEKLEEKKKNPFVAKHFSHLRRMPSSSSVVVAREIAEDAGVSLDEVDSLILAQLMDSYLALREGAEGLARAMGSELSVDRLAVGNFDEPNDDGQYPSYDLKEFKDGLSISMVGDKRMIWSSAEYPELARRALIPDYITLRLLEEVQGFLLEHGETVPESPDEGQPEPEEE